MMTIYVKMPASVRKFVYQETLYLNVMYYPEPETA